MGHLKTLDQMNKYILTAACGLAFSAASAQTKALPDSPNILLILVDDLGYGDLSCQGAAKDVPCREGVART